jgi:hypothetical protein
LKQGFIVSFVSHAEELSIDLPAKSPDQKSRKTACGNVKIRIVSVAKKLAGNAHHHGKISIPRRIKNDKWEYLIDSDKKIGNVRLGRFTRKTVPDL